MNYWVITDTHFNHTRMIELCGRPADFEDRILKSLGNCVQDDDVLIHLGDICWGDDEKWHGILNSTVRGKKWLIRGNHDSKSSSWYLDHGWDFVGSLMAMEVFGHSIAFSHKPTKDIGYSINIHGHFHNTDHRNHEPELVAIKNEKQMLIALEWVDYQTQKLKTLIDKWNNEHN